MIEEVSNVENDLSDEVIEKSFEEILQVEVMEDEIKIETEPMCASCYEPLDVDEEQTTAYCDRCETEVFVHRRIIHSSFKEDCSL